MKRSEIREAAFILSFEKLFSDENAEQIIECAYEADEFDMNDDAEKLFIAVQDKIQEADEIISKYSEKRQINRIPKVTLAILHIALYEIMYDEKIPYNVAVSEAVNIGKKYAFDSDVQFINGVLGAFVREYEKDHTKEVNRPVQAKDN